METTAERERKARELRVAMSDVEHLPDDQRESVLAYRVQLRTVAAAKELVALLELGQALPDVDLPVASAEQAFRDACWKLDWMGFGPRF